MGTPGPGWVSLCLGSRTSARPTAYSASASLEPLTEHPSVSPTISATPLPRRSNPVVRWSHLQLLSFCPNKQSLPLQSAPQLLVLSGWPLAPGPLPVSHGWDPPAREGGPGYLQCEVHTNHQDLDKMQTLGRQVWCGRGAMFPTVPAMPWLLSEDQPLRSQGLMVSSLPPHPEILSWLGIGISRAPR